jgi:hypothetical protein
MLSELVELVDRCFALLDSLAGIEFVREVHRCLRVLEREPRLHDLLSDLRAEADELGMEYARYDAEEMPRLERLRQEVAAVAPEIDRDVSEPFPDDRSVADVVNWWSTMAAFDHIAAGRPFYAGGGRRDYQSRTHRLSKILLDKIHELRWPEPVPGNTRPQNAQDARPELEPLARRLGDIRSAEEAHYERTRIDQMTHPGVALAALEEATRALVLGFYRLSSAPQRPSWYDPLRSTAGVYWSPDHDALEKALKTSTDQPSLAPWIEHLKRAARRLHQGLRLKIGSARSLRGLLGRFKARCEWHDRARLEDIAKSRVKEDRLTEELARWLFDQGLNPLTNANVAGLRPDILDPGNDPAHSLYVEAKDYKMGEDVRKVALDGLKQLYNTVLRLRGDHYSLTEAFFVVFRRSGPDLIMPTQIMNEGWVVYPVTVDIGPATKSGSRQRQRPIQISFEEVRPIVGTAMLALGTQPVASEATP